MHTSNDAYAHRQILSSAAGRPDMAIWGVIQHGWSERAPFWPSDAYRRKRILPLLSWSESGALRGVAAGQHRARAIGAPFLYMVQGLLDLERGPRDQTVLIPPHGTALSPRRFRHEDWVKEVSHSVSGDVVVLMHPNELNDAKVRDAYTSYGFRIAEVSGDTRSVSFLSDRAELFLGAKRVVVNEITTAPLFAAYLGAEVEMREQRSSTIDPFEGEMESAARTLFPQLLSIDAGEDDWLKVAEIELGVDDMVNAESLAECLGQNSYKRPLLKRWMTARKSAGNLRRRVLDRK